MGYQQRYFTCRDLFQVYIKNGKRVSKEVGFVKSSETHFIYSFKKGRYWNDADRKLVCLGRAKVYIH